MNIQCSVTVNPNAHLDNESDWNQSDEMNLISGQYRRGKKIGMGSFCTVYIGLDVLSGEEVALKVDKCRDSQPLLSHEHKVYARFEGCAGFPRIHHFGQENGYNILVMDILGPSLEDLFNLCGRRFTLRTILKLVDQMIDRIERVHERNIIHRDLKPDNFVTGIKHQSQVIHLIDFGLAKQYYNSYSRCHISYQEGKSMCGTARYASLNAHMGIELSRRDDMESLGYMLVYFLQGHLPWQGISATNKKERFEKIMERKMSTNIDDLCAGAPKEFAVYLKYCRNMNFEEQPDYKYWRDTFRKLYMRSQNLQCDFAFDWVGLNHPRLMEQESNDASTVPDNDDA
uniref:non-specific serine/threonine protein kinase n=1 Tax=Anopheles epiroticus TaxID=199890 RepID=A0A182PEC5_9DIPT